MGESGTEMPVWKEKETSPWTEQAAEDGDLGEQTEGMVRCCSPVERNTGGEGENGGREGQ